MHNYFYLNTIFENYGIEDMTIENDFKIEKHLAIHVTKGHQLIILPRDISSKLILIIILILLKVTLIK